MNTHLKLVTCWLWSAIGSWTSIPKGVIKRDKMENSLVEIHTAEAISETNFAEYGSNAQKEKLAAEVLKKNGVTKAEFDSSLSFYSSRLDLYMKIYQKVTERLVAQKENLTESVLAFERTLMTPVGDTVDIWNKSSQIVLEPGVLANRVHEIKVDTNFHNDYQLVLNFKLLNQPADSNTYVRVVLGNAATNEITKAVSQNINQPGWNTVSFEDKEYKLGDNVFTSFTLIQRGKPVHELYIDSISLMRYHKKGTENIHGVYSVASEAGKAADSALVIPEGAPDRNAIGELERQRVITGDSVTPTLDKNSVNVK